MRLSRFTPAGIARFSQFLDEVRAEGSGSFPDQIMIDGEFSQAVSESVVAPVGDFKDRLAAAVYVEQLLKEADLSDVERDTGLWAWLAARNFSSLCRKNPSGVLRPGERARWILEPTNFQRYYRHLLAGPYLIYRAHKDDPSRARALLCGAVNTPGEVAEQLASRMELISNRALVEVASRLYVDPNTGKLKRGAGGKGPGSPRRLADVVNQFDLTFDLYGMSADGLLALLPAEFNRFNQA
jgi:hypothetical protein